jgi:hypothetical protein
MLQEATRCLDKIGENSDPRKIREIRGQLSSFAIDPSDWELGDGAPSLVGEGCGTHFFIQPADPIIQEDIDNRQSGSKATRFERNLIGFTNTMVPGRAPPIIARFRDHKSEATPIELIGDAAFFTPGEFQEVDHHFQGTFDETASMR